VGFEKLDPRILPHMSVKVAFQNAAQPEVARRNLTLPQAAIHQLDGRDVVFVVRDGRIERRAVTIDTRHGDEVAIAAGLGGGERVVVEGADNLADGSAVTEAKQ
jgi:HlyD family secretion protein